MKGTKEMMTTSESSTSKVKISNNSVAVDQSYYWRPLSDCPQGVKIQALSNLGVARYDEWKGQADIVAWAPLPKIPNWLNTL